MSIMCSLPVWALIVGQLGHDWALFTLGTELPKYMKSVLFYNVTQVCMLQQAANRADTGPLDALWAMIALLCLLRPYTQVVQTTAPPLAKVVHSDSSTLPHIITQFRNDIEIGRRNDLAKGAAEEAKIKLWVIGTLVLFI